MIGRNTSVVHLASTCITPACSPCNGKDKMAVYYFLIITFADKCLSTSELKNYSIVTGCVCKYYNFMLTSYMSLYSVRHFGNSNDILLCIPKEKML